jgi:Tfp pilus assembly protein PilX
MEERAQGARTLYFSIMIIVMLAILALLLALAGVLFPARETDTITGQTKAFNDANELI